MVDLEAGLEVAAQDARRVVRQRPRAGGAAGDRVEHALEVEPGPVGVEQRLADADHPAGDRDLVDHLRVLPGAGAALDARSFCPSSSSSGSARSNAASAPPAMITSVAFARADVAAGHRRVERLHPALRRRLGDLARERRLARRHVDHHRAGRRRREHAVGAEDHLAHVGGEADDRDDDVGVGRGLGRRVAPARPALDERRRHARASG